jgi:hypothetical protein
VGEIPVVPGTKLRNQVHRLIDNPLKKPTVYSFLFLLFLKSSFTNVHVVLKVRLPKPPPEDHSVVLSTTNLVSQTASASVMKSFFTSLSLVLILHLVPFSVFFVDKSKSFDFESLATVQNAYHQTSESISKNYNQSNKTGS